MSYIGKLRNRARAYKELDLSNVNWFMIGTSTSYTVIIRKCHFDYTWFLYKVLKALVLFSHPFYVVWKAKAPPTVRVSRSFIKYCSHWVDICDFHERKGPCWVLLLKIRMMQRIRFVLPIWFWYPIWVWILTS